MKNSILVFSLIIGLLPCQLNGQQKITLEDQRELYSLLGKYLHAMENKDDSATFSLIYSLLGSDSIMYLIGSNDAVLKQTKKECQGIALRYGKFRRWLNPWLFNANIDCLKREGALFLEDKSTSTFVLNDFVNHPFDKAYVFQYDKKSGKFKLK